MSTSTDILIELEDNIPAECFRRGPLGSTPKTWLDHKSLDKRFPEEVFGLCFISDRIVNKRRILLIKTTTKEELFLSLSPWAKEGQASGWLVIKEIPMPVLDPGVDEVEWQPEIYPDPFDEVKQ
jgi:hypothetical protein